MIWILLVYCLGCSTAHVPFVGAMPVTVQSDSREYATEKECLGEGPNNIAARNPEKRFAYLCVQAFTRGPPLER